MYLHSRGVAHGDIKGVSPLTLPKVSIVKLSPPQPNILISDSTPPFALLGDFGSIHVMTISVMASRKKQLGMASFMAPELLLPANFGLDKGLPSKEADVYALGMTVYQVLTGRWPFFPRREAEVILAVISGERPPKPENAEEIGITEVLWELLKECWKENKADRPTGADVLKRFCEIIGEGKTTDSAPEGISAPWLNTGNRSSVVSRGSSAVSCE